eukprot:Rhum_TRINITY_DN13163_c0_g1::Rhum_TRINITY_DN13163_c0_g1_i1::g.57550::m.57550
MRLGGMRWRALSTGEREFFFSFRFSFSTPAFPEWAFRAPPLLTRLNAAEQIFFTTGEFLARELLQGAGVVAGVHRLQRVVVVHVRTRLVHFEEPRCCVPLYLLRQHLRHRGRLLLVRQPHLRQVQQAEDVVEREEHVRAHLHARPHHQAQTPLPAEALERVRERGDVGKYVELFQAYAPGVARQRVAGGHALGHRQVVSANDVVNAQAELDCLPHVLRRRAHRVERRTDPVAVEVVDHALALLALGQDRLQVHRVEAREVRHLQGVLDEVVRPAHVAAHHGHLALTQLRPEQVQTCALLRQASGHTRGAVA